MNALVLKTCPAPATCVQVRSATSLCRHYLSALAFLGNNTGNEALLKRSSYLVDELRAVQQKLGGRLPVSLPQGALHAPAQAAARLGPLLCGVRLSSCDSPCLPGARERKQQKLGGGYLSAFPDEHFALLRRLQPIWTPFYVVCI